MSYLNDFKKVNGFSELLLEEFINQNTKNFEDNIYLKRNQHNIEVFLPDKGKTYIYTLLENGLWYMYDAEFIKTINDSLITKHFIFPKSWIIKHESYKSVSYIDAKLALSYSNDSVQFELLIDNSKAKSNNDILNLNQILEITKKLECFINEECELDSSIEISSKYNILKVGDFVLYYTPIACLDQSEVNNSIDKDSLRKGKLVFGKRLLSNFDLDIEEVEYTDIIRWFPGLKYQ
mgnify:CR=1 FL=1